MQSSRLKIPRRSVAISMVLAIMMVSSLAFSYALMPTQKMADKRAAFDLEGAVPHAFGDWREQRHLVAAVVNPQTEAALNKIYGQTLSRTYINKAGERIMLSIAYGNDQGGDATQAHRPEICYAAQGFALRNNHVDSLQTTYGSIPVRRLIAVNGARNEPITYWVTVGDKATLPGFRRKLVQLSYGLNGTVPDGLIFRVSSIQADAHAAYKLQDNFVEELFGAITSAQQQRLAGSMAQAAKAVS